MSRSTPVCALFCAKCKRNSARFNARHYERDFIRPYLDVVIIGRAGKKARCRCKRCGYQYNSGSRAALRKLDKLEHQTRP